MMAIGAGTRLGPYEITGSLGAGGMGQVFRAKDTRLGRDVAIKVPFHDVAGDEARRQRFQREARAVAALNHPHICTIHDVGSESGVDFLVLEVLQGESLASRLRRGPLPLDEALARGIEIARALDSAHQNGIVHRDLKPGNVMLTASGAKVLDFGLARIARGETDMPSAPAGTSTASLTQAGVVLGTLPYMAPEQIEGRVADARTDVFAFGATLYEMLTGKRAFEAASTPGLIGAIVRGDTPSLLAMLPNLPPAIDHTIRTCLAKERDARFSSLNDVAIILQWARAAASDRRATASIGSITTATPRRSLVALLLVAAAALAGVGTVVWFRRPVPASTELRLEISTPRTVAPHEFALSPDGRNIVANIVGGGPANLWVRQLDTAAVRQLESGAFPFWSPDSRSIGYFSGGALKRVDLIDGKVQTLASVNPGCGGSWSDDGTILFGSVDGPVMRVPEKGGEARAATRIEPGQTGHRFPQFLPDNRHFLYYVVGNDDQQGLYLTSLDGVGKRIAKADSAAAVLSNDRIIFNTQGVIAVHQLDLTRGVLVGQPQTVIESAPINAYFAPEVSVAANGAIAYRSWVDQRQLRWFDRAGTPLESVGGPSRDGVRRARLSPDGRRLALDRIVLGNRDLWIREPNGALARITADRSADGYPVWSPDGSQIAFLSDRHGSFDIFVASSSGSRPEKELLRVPGNQWPLDWSRDGRWLLYYDANNAGDLWAMPMVGDDRTPVPIAQSVFAESDAALSPDGRWVAYPSNDSGSTQIVVQSFPTATAKWTVSANGGLGPVWSASGKELFFVAPDGKLMVVPIRATSVDFNYGTASALFQTRIVNTSIPLNGAEFAVSADGRMMVNEAVDDLPSPITVILNWNAGVK